MTASAQTAKPVIEAKLYPGVGAGRPIERKRLYPPQDFLEGASSVFLIKAPAGYGKSTLMSQLHECLREKTLDCAWLSLDADDNDPNRFIHYLVAAIERVLPGFLKDSLAQVDTELSNSKVVLETLAIDLGSLDSQLVIFIDDIQYIDNPDVLDILDWLISYAPPRCQFVLGSREEPNLHLGRLRVRRRLLEADISQMAFSLDEAREFLNARLHPALSDKEIIALHRRTEGWPAGLELAVMALEEETDRNQLILTFAGDDQSVVSYLGEVVLGNLHEKIRRFVYQIAQFNRISGKLAEQVTGREDAAALLQEIRNRNMFLIPLDRQGEWYRFHHFVGQYLRDRCRLEDPSLANQALLDGAHWLYEHGNIEEAINCALQAEAWALAAQWVADNANSFIYEKGYLQTILGWMNALPRKWIDQYPTIRSNYAFAMSFYMRRRGVDEQIQYLREHRDDLARADKPDQAAIDEMDCLIEHLGFMSSGLEDQGEHSRDLARQWLQRWPAAAANLRGDAWNVLAYGYKSSGEIQLGLQACDNSERIGKENNLYYVLCWSHQLRAYLHMKRGDYNGACESAQLGLHLVQQEMGGNRINASMFHAILGCVAYEFGEHDQLARHVDACSDITDEYAQADFTILKYLAQARMLFTHGDHKAALECLRNGQTVGKAHSLRRISLSLATEECIWLCRLGRLDEAHQVAVRNGIPVHEELTTKPERIELDKAFRTGTRLFLHEAPADAARLLKSGIRYCLKKNYRHRAVELLLIQAIAYRHCRETDLATASLKQALAVGTTEGYYQIYLDEAGELHDLLLQLKLGKDDAASQPLLYRLQKALKHSTSGKPENIGEGLIEKLSKRESQILKRLDSELSNREIAEAIFVSEGTLKWHLHNIYGKLGVKNRTGALIRARELNYL